MGKITKSIFIIGGLFIGAAIWSGFTSLKERRETDVAAFEKSHGLIHFDDQSRPVLQLKPGDVITINGQKYKMEANGELCPCRPPFCACQ